MRAVAGGQQELWKGPGPAVSRAETNLEPLSARLSEGRTVAPVPYRTPMLPASEGIGSRREAGEQGGSHICTPVHTLRPLGVEGKPGRGPRSSRQDWRGWEAQRREEERCSSSGIALRG